MTAVIVDDNASMRETLSTLLGIYALEIVLLAEANGVKDGIDKIKEYKPDLVFLDVEMEDGTGFDLLSRYGKIDFRFIFVTGHDSYAIRAFKFSAIDYILKPIDPDDLTRALDKAANTPALENDLKVKTFISNKKASNEEKKIVLNDAQNTYLIGVKEIVRCEADVNYTCFYLADGRQIVVSKTLKSFDEMLCDHGFFRSHQSHLINLDFFDRFDKSEGGVIYLKNGDAIPISTRKRENLMTVLNQL